MKRINYILMATVLPVMVLLFSAVAVSAKEANQKAPAQVTLSLSTDNAHFGGTVMATATFTDPSSIENYIGVVDWGDSTVEEGWWYDPFYPIKWTHPYRTPGQHSIVVIVAMPDGEQISTSADLYVESADETLEFLIGHVDELVHDDGLDPEQGQSLVNHLEDAQASLGEEQPEAAVEALEEYLNELAGYIEAGLPVEEDAGKTVAEDMVNLLLADPTG